MNDMTGGQNPRAGLPETLPGLLWRHAQERPRDVALREKRLGIWHETTYREFYDNVAVTASILEAYGVRPGDYVAIFSDNRSEWIYAELAAMLVGAIGLGIHPGAYESELHAHLRTAGVRVIFCGDQENVDRLLAPPDAQLAGKALACETIFVFDPRGVRGYADPRLRFWPELFAEEHARYEGSSATRTDRESRLTGRSPGDPDRICSVLFTSGRTDLPRGIHASHGALLATARELTELFHFTGRDRSLCYLPLCHYVEKMFGIVLPLYSGMVVHLVESDETVLEDLREVSPSVFISWPRFWNRFRLGTIYRMSQASLVREFFFDYFLDFRVDRIKLAPGQKRSLWFRLVSFLGDVLFFRALQNRLGLRDCRLALTTGDEIKEHTIQWFLGLGIPLTDYYATSESCGAGFINQAGTEQTGSQGRAFSGLRYRFARDRELTLKGPYLCSTYFTNAVEETPVEREGWFYTGDTGFEDARERLRLTANKSHLARNADGERFSLKRTEDVLRECPYIREIVCVGEGRPFVTALIEPDFERTSDEIRLENVRFKRYEDLPGVPAVVELLDREIGKLNEDLIEVERVRAFRILPAELREENGELSFDDSPRRRVVEQRYADLIEEMYR